MKLNKVLDDLNEFKEQNLIKDNPTESFARILMHLYREPTMSDAKSLSKEMLKMYGEKTLDNLLAKAQEVVNSLKQ
jgi:hypothetical protein